jgi:hypothetical protein
MQMSGQHHAPLALTSDEEHLLPVGYEAGRAVGPRAGLHVAESFVGD